MRVCQLRGWLIFSLILNLLFGWYIYNNSQDNIRMRRELKELAILDDSVRALIHVFPKETYTRNELALAITAPGKLPIVQDCLVKFNDLAFVFDRSNVILAIYPWGQIPDHYLRGNYLDRNFKCDSSLLQEGIERYWHGKPDWDARTAPARKMLSDKLSNDDPKWGLRINDAQQGAALEWPDKRAIQ